MTNAEHQRAYRERKGKLADDMKAVITEANNSLFGSHGFFLSVQGAGAEPEPFHLAAPIESLKAAANRRYNGLQAIIARLDGNDKPLAVELRKIAEEALS